MTIGKDVSTLFTDVINCIQTGKNFQMLSSFDVLINIATCFDKPFIRQSGAEEASLSVFDKLCEEPARFSIASSKYICERCK